MENLKVALVQTDIFWESIDSNLKKYEAVLDETEKTDVIVFPEMFTTGFSMQPNIFKEKMNGKTMDWMKKMAAKNNAALVGSLIIEENAKVFNRAVWVNPDGQTFHYDKRHLYTMGHETEHYSAGQQKLVVEYRGWRFCPLICYDLRFPVWSRNAENYDVLLYMANWPSPRHHVWKNLLVARAVENQSYCFGVNRCGTDGTGLNYLGDSAMVTPKGFAEFLGETETTRSFEISWTELHDFRKNFPLLDDRDEFKIF